MRKEKKLCYRCDERFNQGHKCKNRELQFLVVKEKVTEDKEEDEEGEEEVMVGDVELSIKSVVRLTTPKNYEAHGCYFWGKR